MRDEFLPLALQRRSAALDFRRTGFGQFVGERRQGRIVNSRQVVSVPMVSPSLEFKALSDRVGVGLALLFQFDE